MTKQFTSILVNGDPLKSDSLIAGAIQTVQILDDDPILQSSEEDTGTQFGIGGDEFTSSAWPGFIGTGVEIYSASVNGNPVTFGYLTAAGDHVDDNANRLVVLSGKINPGNKITNIKLINEGNTNVPYGSIPSVVCFTPRTQIATPTGPAPIETLSVGDLVITADNGPQPIRWIGRKHLTGAILQPHHHLRPIRIKAHAFGHNHPDRDLSVSPQHRMFLKSHQAQLMFGESEVLVPAKGLINDKTILVDSRATQVDYIHILFDSHQLVQANGTWSESFHPGTVGLGAIENNAKAELFDIFPELEKDTGTYGPAARFALKVSEARVLEEDRFPLFAD